MRPLKISSHVCRRERSGNRIGRERKSIPLFGSYPVDEGDLRRTVFQYVKTRIHNHNREVFRIIKAAVEKEEMLRKWSKIG